MQLAQIGPRAAEAVPEIAAAAAEAPDELLKNYTAAVHRIGPAAVPHLIKLLEQQDAQPAAVVSALLCLQEFGPSAREAVAVLKTHIHHEASGIRLAAVDTLRQIGPAAEDAVEELFRQAEVEEGSEIRERIYEAIGAIAGAKAIEDYRKPG